VWCRLRSAAAFFVFALLGPCPLVVAQSSISQDTQSGVNPGGAVSHPLQIAVSGCLKLGANGSEYSIVDNNGRTWKLVPDGVNLAEYIDHRVMITGKPDGGAQQQAGKLDRSANPQISVRVLTAKTLSSRCTP